MATQLRVAEDPLGGGGGGGGGGGSEEDGALKGVNFPIASDLSTGILQNELC